MKQTHLYLQIVGLSPWSDSYLSMYLITVLLPFALIEYLFKS